MDSIIQDQDVDNRCRGCGGELRWDTEHYAYPRWVHVRVVDLVICGEGFGR